jgi:hypothetical protein
VVLAKKRNATCQREGRTEALSSYTGTCVEVDLVPPDPQWDSGGLGKAEDAEGGKLPCLYVDQYAAGVKLLYVEW